MTAERKPLSWLVNHLATCPEGTRNITLLWATCRGLEEGHDPAEVAQAMYGAAIASGLEERESKRTIQSAFDRVRKKQPPPTFEEVFSPERREEFAWIDARIAEGISLVQAQAEWDEDHPPPAWWEEEPEEEPTPAPPVPSGIVQIDYYRTTIPSRIEWVATNITYRGGVTLLSGPPKGGKSTLLAQLQWAREGESRDFIGEQVPQGPMLLITEEGGLAVIYKMPDLHNVYIYDRRAAGIESFADTLAKAENWYRDHTDGIVVIDTLAIWAGIEDENDAAKTTAAVSKVMLLAQTTDAPVDIVHHSRKSGGSHGEAIRGSGAILATVDTSAELKRTKDIDADDRYLDLQGRVLLPARYALAFDRLTLRYSRTDPDALKNDAIEAMLDGIPATGAGVDREWLANHWHMNQPRRRIDHLLNIGRLREGKAPTGRRGSDKAVYWSIPPVYLLPSFDDDEDETGS